uniref:Uncharacterized protein n=1 Tax=Magallana gigas TaxID=29159 RepID=A0A8W8K460_MAGGI
MEGTVSDNITTAAAVNIDDCRCPPSPYYLVAIPFTTVQCVKQNKIDLAALFAHGDLVITKQRRKSNVDGKEE